MTSATSSQTLETESLGRVFVEFEVHHSGLRYFYISKSSEETILDYSSDSDNEYLAESLTMQEAIAFLSEKLTRRELADLIINLVYCSEID